MVPHIIGKVGGAALGFFKCYNGEHYIMVCAVFSTVNMVTYYFWKKKKKLGRKKKKKMKTEYVPSGSRSQDVQLQAWGQVCCDTNPTTLSNGWEKKTT